MAKVCTLQLKASYMWGKPNALFDKFDIEESKKIIPSEITGRTEDGLEKFASLLEDFNAALSYHSSFWWRWGMTYSPIWFLIPWCAVAAIAHAISGLLLFGSLIGGLVLFLILVNASRREEIDRVNTVKQKVLDVIGNFHLENSKTLDVGLEWWEYVTYYDSRTGRKRIGSCGFDIVDLRAGTWKFPVHGQQLNPVNQPMQPMDHLNHQQSVSTSTFNIS